MTTPFAITMARREGRASRRRLGLYMGSISLGVAALVAINSFRANVTEAIHNESRALLGADIEVRSLRPFPDTVQRVIDSVETAGARVSSVTNFASMALARKTGHTRLVEVRAVSGDFPFYGTIETDPPDRWQSLQSRHYALVDPAVLIHLEVELGDTISIGTGDFVVHGVLSKVPGEFGIFAAFGGRVYIPAAYLNETGLLTTGSRTVYRTFLGFEESGAVAELTQQYEEQFRNLDVRLDTATEREDDFIQATDLMSRFLGLVGLVALLLGGIGVASAVHVYVKSKLPTIAVLRCIGAPQPTVFSIYLLQAGVLGALGSAVGVGLGLIVQVNLPNVLRNFLPLEVPVAIEWSTVVAGLAIGTWVATIFALLPLLEVRNVSPLQALRHEYDSESHHGKQKLGAFVAIAVTMIALSLWQAPFAAVGAAFAAALAGTTLTLWLVAWLTMKAVRRFFPRRAPFVVRQGIANLFRPHNQTVAVTLAIGFGVFLIATLYVSQTNLLRQIEIDASPDRPTLMLFDIQPDQRDSVEAIITARGFPLLGTTAIVPSRITRINGRSVREMLNDSISPPRVRWPLTREYMNTYRDTLVASEKLVAGSWWSAETTEDVDSFPRVSLEQDLARQLEVDLGDRITWDVQGIEIETEIANLRQVDWARFETNFFVVFEPGILEDAPQTFVAPTRAVDPVTRAELQRDLVLAFPNVSSMDLAAVQEIIETVLGSVAFAIRFMALFSIASGIIVLIGALATSRYHRVRESVLLRTLGARRRLVSHILLTEYSSLGILAGLTGTMQGIVAGWIAVRYLFQLTFHLPGMPLLLLCIGTAATTAVIGLLNSRDVFSKPPMAVIREMSD
ncbi:MAG: FtsX-like permease family protein [Gemmatimonadota bacterium]|nr:MAG: FtsX-like permease family protein [Gemmatimonadota bacterium]